MPKARDRAQLKSSSKLKVPCTDSRESQIVGAALHAPSSLAAPAALMLSLSVDRCGLLALNRCEDTIRCLLIDAMNNAKTLYSDPIQRFCSAAVECTVWFTVYN